MIWSFPELGGTPYGPKDSIILIMRKSTHNIGKAPFGGCNVDCKHCKA